MMPFQDGGKQLGIRIAGVRPSSVVAHAGIEPDDVVLTVNGVPLNDTAWYDQVSSQRGQALAVLEIIRRGGRVVIAVHWTA